MNDRRAIAWRAIMSKLRAYYIHNVFHTHNNEFGKGTASEGVMTLVRAIDQGVDIDGILDQVHVELPGVAFVNNTVTGLAYEKLKEALSS